MNASGGMHFGHTSYALKIYPRGVFEMLGQFGFLSEVMYRVRGIICIQYGTPACAKGGLGVAGGGLARSSHNAARCPFTVRLHAVRWLFALCSRCVRHAAIVNCRTLPRKPL